MKSQILSIGTFSVLAIILTLPVFGTAEYTHPTPILHITEIPDGSLSTTTYAIELINNSASLNMFEFEVEFSNADVELTALDIASDLCEERFTVQNEIDTIAGNWHVACGTITPHTAAQTRLATFSLTTKTSQASAVVFGESTHFYLHDGKGTEITPHTIGIIHNRPAV